MCHHISFEPWLTRFVSWGPGKHATNTVHVDDVAGALWVSAQWMTQMGRKEANSIAGEEIIFKAEKNKIQVEGMAPAEPKCIAPLFNIVSTGRRYDHL